MNGIQELIQHFIANTLGHKVSSMIGAIAAVLLAAYGKALATGLVDPTILPPKWAHILALAVSGLVFVAGLAYNKPTAP